MRCVLIVICILLIPAGAGGRTLEWDLSGVTDEGGWASWQPHADATIYKVGLVVYCNGVEIARVWDNPGNRSHDLGAWEPPPYSVIYGRLIFFAPPYPDTPDSVPLPEPVQEIDEVEYRDHLRRLDDGTTVGLRRGRMRGSGVIRFGVTR